MQEDKEEREKPGQGSGGEQDERIINNVMAWLLKCELWKKNERERDIKLFIVRVYLESFAGPSHTFALVAHTNEEEEGETST